jgi:hypothetical protein
VLLYALLVRLASTVHLLGRKRALAAQLVNLCICLVCLRASTAHQPSTRILTALLYATTAQLASGRQDTLASSNAPRSRPPRQLHPQLLAPRCRLLGIRLRLAHPVITWLVHRVPLVRPASTPPRTTRMFALRVPTASLRAPPHLHAPTVLLEHTTKLLASRALIVQQARLAAGLVGLNAIIALRANSSLLKFTTCATHAPPDTGLAVFMDKLRVQQSRPRTRPHTRPRTRPRTPPRTPHLSQRHPRHRLLPQLAILASSSSTHR